MTALAAIPLIASELELPAFVRPRVRSAPPSIRIRMSTPKNSVSSTVRFKFFKIQKLLNQKIQRSRLMLRQKAEISQFVIQLSKPALNSSRNQMTRPHTQSRNTRAYELLRQQLSSPQSRRQFGCVRKHENSKKTSTGSMAHRGQEVRPINRAKMWEIENSVQQQF